MASTRKFRRPYPRRKPLADLLIPIFCTTDIGPEIVDEFLKRELDRGQRQGSFEQFFLVTTAFTPPPTKEERTGCFLGGAIKATTVPVPPFESPYIGWTADELRETWRTLYSGHPFTGAIFIVLDERTKREKDRKSCLLVADFRYKAVARAEFGMGAEILGGPELGIHDLNEGKSSDYFKDPENSGEFYYTEENFDSRF